MEKPATVVSVSMNGKTGPVAATYASQASCPNACPLRNAGCYAETGHAGITTHRLNKSTIVDLDTIATIEAEGIRKLRGGIPLRVHVVGDCSTDSAAAIVSSAMVEYDGPAWTYTHAWRFVSRESWGKASVLASCENTNDVRDATARGYATAIVVDSHDSNSAYVRDGINIIPCPEQTKGVQCVSCKLCMNADRLKGTIGFAAHGIQVKKVRATLDKRNER